MSIRSGSTVEQMNRYRDGAIDAVNLAMPCEDTELREAYLSIAKTWTELADKLERDLHAKGSTPSGRKSPASVESTGHKQTARSRTDIIDRLATITRSAPRAFLRDAAGNRV